MDASATVQTEAFHRLLAPDSRLLLEYAVSRYATTHARCEGYATRASALLAFAALFGAVCPVLAGLAQGVRVESMAEQWTVLLLYACALPLLGWTLVISTNAIRILTLKPAGALPRVQDISALIDGGYKDRRLAKSITLAIADADEELHCIAEQRARHFNKSLACAKYALWSAFAGALLISSAYISAAWPTQQTCISAIGVLAQIMILLPGVRAVTMENSTHDTEEADSAATAEQQHTEASGDTGAWSSKRAGEDDRAQST